MSRIIAIVFSTIGVLRKKFYVRLRTPGQAHLTDRAVLKKKGVLLTDEVLLTVFMTRFHTKLKHVSREQQHVKYKTSAVSTLFNPVPQTHPPPTPWKPQPTIITLPSFYPVHSQHGKKNPNQRRPLSEHSKKKNRERESFSKK